MFDIVIFISFIILYLFSSYLIWPINKMKKENKTIIYEHGLSSIAYSIDIPRVLSIGAMFSLVLAKNFYILVYKLGEKVIPIIYGDIQMDLGYYINTNYYCMPFLKVSIFFIIILSNISIYPITEIKHLSDSETWTNKDKCFISIFLLGLGYYIWTSIILYKINLLLFVFNLAINIVIFYLGLGDCLQHPTLTNKYKVKTIGVFINFSYIIKSHITNCIKFIYCSSFRKEVHLESVKNITLIWGSIKYLNKKLRL